MRATIVNVLKIRSIAASGSWRLGVRRHEPSAPADGYFGSFLFTFVLLLVLLFVSGCQQKMAEQPSYRTLEECAFFADGRSERPAVPGTVARGYLPTDVELTTGRRPGKNGEPIVALPAKKPPEPDTPEGEKAQEAFYRQFTASFPFPMTEAVLEHGYNRFMIYCVMCHDPLGTGQGKIVERGYTAPPSYHIRAAAHCAGRLSVRGGDRGLWFDAVVCGANSRSRSLGDCRLSTGTASQPAFSGRQLP